MGGKKAGGGFMGIGGESGFLNTGLFSSGPQKIKGFEMSNGLKNAEAAMIARQSQIASGQAPSIAGMQFNQNLDAVNQAALAMAASQRGASNPALAFRQAQQMGQQANMEGAQQAAILAEEERRKAEMLIAQQAAAAKGLALNQAQANLNSTLQNQQNQTSALSGLGQAGASMFMGGGKK